MNSLQIDRILKNHYATRSNYHGCYAADELKSLKLNFPCTVVVNTDVSTKPGKHWVAIYFVNSNSLEYFDSLSEEPNEQIAQFLSQFKVIKNEKILQNLFSDACGQFCIYFVVKRSLGVSFNNIVKFLYKIKNADHFVKNFVNALLA